MALLWAMLTKVHLVDFCEHGYCWPQPSYVLVRVQWITILVVMRVCRNWQLTSRIITAAIIVKFSPGLEIGIFPFLLILWSTQTWIKYYRVPFQSCTSLIHENTMFVNTLYKCHDIFTKKCVAWSCNFYKVNMYLKLKTSVFSELYWNFAFLQNLTMLKPMGRNTE